MTKIHSRHLNAVGAYHFGNQSINGKRMLRDNNVIAVIHKHPHDKIQNIAGTITQSDLLRFDTEFFTQGFFQLKTGSIRIQSYVLQRRLNGGQRLRPRTHRVFVTCEFNDISFIETQLTGQLINRLARLIRTQCLNTRYCQLQKIDCHVLPRYSPQGRMRCQSTALG